MLTPRLRERLSRLARGISAEPDAAAEPAIALAAPPAPVPESTPPPADPWFLHYDLQACGEAMESDGGSCFLVRPDLTALLPDHEAWLTRWMKLAAEEWSPPERRLFVDIETAGLAAAPLFLIGSLTVEDGGLCLRQYLARDYTEEASILDRFFATAASYERLITFNGQTFDVPYLIDRAIYHRRTAGFAQEHTDLLPLARRAWRGGVPDCRLATLETHLCGRRRVGDVAGADIPLLYHDFVRTGSWDLLAPVLHHNALDLLTMADLAARLPGD